MRRLYSLVLMFGVGGSLLLAVLALPVVAQTPTPTSTPTRTPRPTATITPTPGPTPAGDPALSTVVWGCLVYPSGAPVCTWGDYFEFTGETVATGSGSTTYWPGASGESASYILVPNANTKAITATCSFLLDSQSIDNGVGSAAASSYAGLSAPISVFDQYVESAAAGDVNYSVSSSGNDADELFVTVNVVWRLRSSVSSWPGDSAFSYTYANRGNFARFAGRVQASSTGSQNTGIGYIRAACEINAVERLSDGSVYVPSTPTVGDGPTPTPCPGGVCWEDFQWVDYGPYLHAPPQSSWFEFSESSSTCYTVLYGANFSIAPGWLDDVFGITSLGVSWPSRALCLDQWTISSELMNISLSTMVSGFLSALVILWMLRVLRSST